LLVVQRDFAMLLRGLRRGLRARHGLGEVVRWASIAALGWLVATLAPWLKGGTGPAGWLMGLLPGLTPGLSLMGVLFAGLVAVAGLAVMVGLRVTRRPALPAGE